jgi:hypothetical protein
MCNDDNETINLQMCNDDNECVGVQTTTNWKIKFDLILKYLMNEKLKIQIN